MRKTEKNGGLGQPVLGKFEAFRRQRTMYSGEQRRKLPERNQNTLWRSRIGSEWTWKRNWKYWESMKETSIPGVIVRYEKWERKDKVTHQLKVSAGNMGTGRENQYHV